MPTKESLTPIEEAWINFTKSVRLLFVVQPDDRPLDQYLEFRDKVLALIDDPRFLADLKKGWTPFTDSRGKSFRFDVGETLLMELQAFPRAVEVAQATEAPKGLSKAFLDRWLSRAATVSGSVKDLVENLPPYAKSALSLFKELCSLFKGKE